MKRQKVYLKEATRFLTKIFEDNLPTVANLVCAEADDDYEPSIKLMEDLKVKISNAIDNLKSERDICL